MLMQKIRDNAIWVVVIAVISFIALIFVDWGMSPGNQYTHKTTVGKVLGEKIRFEDLDKAVQNQQAAAAREGRELSAEENAQIRKQVFDMLANQVIFGKIFQEYQLRGTPLEVLDFLTRNPPQGAMNAPIFMGPDSQFNPAIYTKWLHDERTFSDPFMRDLEQQAITADIPQQHLARLLTAGLPVSSLEVAYRSKLEAEHYWGIAAAVPTDSIPAQTATDEQVQKYFDAHPDSFYVGVATARVPFVWLPKVATAEDSAQVRADMDSILVRARSGESFDTLARTYSEDRGSAAQGGKLGGFQKRSSWVPAFSDAVAGLTPGQISEPVLSQFGWHVIKLNDRKVENGDTLFDASHILVAITPSSDAIDRSKDVLESFSALVNDGKSFAEAAKAKGLAIDSISLVEGNLAKTPFGAVTGVSAWAFRGDKEQKVSDVLENDGGLLVAGPARITPKGRDLNAIRDALRARVVQKLELEQTLALAKASEAKVKACADEACLNTVPKLTVTALSDRPGESFIPGFGYGDPGFYRLVAQARKAQKTWVGPISVGSGAGFVRIDSVSSMDEKAVQAQAAQIQMRVLNNPRTAGQGLQEWFAARRKAAKIENNLDQFYRD